MHGATTATAPRRRYRGLAADERRSEQRARILAAARHAFAARGFAVTSIEDIVAGARVSRTTFYRHFETKEDCLLAVFSEGCTRLLDALQEVAANEGLTPDRKVRKAVERFVATLAADQAMARVVLVEAVGATPRAERQRAHARVEFAAVIEGELRKVDYWRARPAAERELVAMATMAAVAEPVTHLVALRRLGEWRSVVRPLADLALRALSPPS